MGSVITSFLSLMSIPCVILLFLAALRRVVFKSDWPKPKELVINISIACVITFLITLAICFAFSLSGVFDSFFYRPSSRDYGELKKLAIEENEVFFQSGDKTQLNGRFLPASGNSVGTVIHFHGSNKNLSFTVRNANWLREHGLNVFVFDYRGYGKSEGEPERRSVVADSVAAIDYVLSRPDVDSTKVCLWGQSMGGQLAISAAAMMENTEIRAVVAEATYSSYKLQIKDKVAAMGPLWLIQWGAWLFTSDELSAQDVVGNLESEQSKRLKSAVAGISQRRSIVDREQRKAAEIDRRGRSPFDEVYMVLPKLIGE